MPDSLRDSQAETEEKIEALEEFENTLDRRRIGNRVRGA
jgi:hypothetical protein